MPSHFLPAMCPSLCPNYPFYKDTNLLGFGPTLMTSFGLAYFPKDTISIKATLTGTGGWDLNTYGGGGAGYNLTTPLGQKEHPYSGKPSTEYAPTTPGVPDLESPEAGPVVLILPLTEDPLLPRYMSLPSPLKQDYLTSISMAFKAQQYFTHKQWL